MPKVDWITWKTDVSEIINPDKIMEKMDNLFEDYSCYINALVYEELKHELQFGGLDKLSLNILGTSPANEKAIRILNNIDDVKENFEKLKNNIYNSAIEQKKTEKEQLVKAIEEKIFEEEKILNNTLNLKDRISTSNELVDIETINNVISTTSDKINKLKERLELAKGI